MKIVADANIPLVKTAFDDFGSVETVPGREITRDRIQDAQLLLVRSVTNVNKELLDDTEVRFVASATVGIDHVDTAYLRENSIGFAYAGGSNADSVAQYTIAALLIVAKKLKLELADLALGIIGVGNVGGRVQKIATPFFLKVIANDPPKRVMTGLETYRPIEELLSRSDVISLHVPLTQEGPNPTYHLVNNNFLAAMKTGVLLINTSRGKVVDEKILQTYRKKLNGLILDVWENEPDVNTKMVAMADIATPHIAGYSYEGKLQGTQMIYDAACAFFFKEKKVKLLGGHGKKAVKFDVMESEDPVYDAVVRACPVLEDDARMRKIVEMGHTERSAYFDSLRQNYPERLEYNNYEVVCKKQYAHRLNVLGFKTTVKS